MTDEKRTLPNLLNSTTKSVFDTQDFNKVWKYDNYRSLIRRISYLKKTGKIIQVRRGLYAISGRDVNELELANKLRTPSYITFETVLYREGIIFQWDKRITLAGKESIEFEILKKKIIFRQLKDSILLNGLGISKRDNYHTASKERAVLDMLYIDPSFTFDNLRSIDFGKMRRFTAIYNRKSIIGLIDKLKDHARSY